MKKVFNELGKPIVNKYEINSFDDFKTKREHS